jgi:uncharacterized protein YjdB
MTKKILFFTAGPVPTAGEQGQIDALNALTLPGYNIGVRSAIQPASYGHGIEVSDFVAGTIPTAFNAVPNYGVADTARPCKLQLLPTAPSVAIAATQQLQCLKANGADISALTLADVTAVTTTYASSVAAKATVSAGGLVTGVAAGTTIITATHTYASGKTVTATTTVTVPA